MRERFVYRAEISRILEHYQKIDDFQVRPFQASFRTDLDSLYALVWNLPIDEVTSGFNQVFNDDYCGKLLYDASFLAFNSKMPVSAVLTVDGAPWDDLPKCPFILETLTHPEYRYRGLASLLICEVAKIIKSRGDENLALVVYSDTPNAISLYKKLGFSIYSQ